MFKKPMVLPTKKPYEPGRAVLNEALQSALDNIRLQVQQPLSILCKVRPDDSKHELLGLVDRGCKQLTALMSPSAAETAEHQGPSFR